MIGSSAGGIDRADHDDAERLGTATSNKTDAVPVIRTGNTTSFNTVPCHFVQSHRASGSYSRMMALLASSDTAQSVNWFSCCFVQPGKDGLPSSSASSSAPWRDRDDTFGAVEHRRVDVGVLAAGMLKPPTAPTSEMHATTKPPRERRILFMHTVGLGYASEEAVVSFDF